MIHGDECICTYAMGCITPSLLEFSPKQFEGLLPLTPRAQSTGGWYLNVPILPPHPALHLVASVSCPCAGASHSRGKEILCKSTGSQRRQDSGQAWQGVPVNSSEQADFAQRGQSQQKAFPGQQRRAGYLMSLASGWPSRTWCTWYKADKPKFQYFYFFGPTSRWLPNTFALWLTARHHPQHDMTSFSNFKPVSLHVTSFLT